MENERIIPRHVAIIMDGNGRWAKQHGLERVEGHRAGAIAVKNLVESLKHTGIQYLTLYAFSTENWKRSKEEVDALMELLAEFIDANLPLLMENDVRLLVSGRIEGLPEKAREKLKDAIRKSSANTGGTVIFALNYGGRAEIADAAKKIADQVLKGEISPEQIDEKLFAQNLYLPDVPDPDLLIRTSGELRLSNFLLWELSYAEIYVTDTYWPDFDLAELDKAIDAFQKRNRRFGGR
ncbi:MAG: isoprenyl transferase [Lentisphaerae bacterium]|nr:isoprenyl transferase [Lentisphaerota bacterium]